MTAIVNTLVRTINSVPELQGLQEIAVLCGAGLLISLLCVIYGINFSPDFVGP